MGIIQEIGNDRGLVLGSLSNTYPTRDFIGHKVNKELAGLPFTFGINVIFYY